MEERVTRGDVRGILFEIQRDVNILLYIEPERQSEKVFPDEMRAASFPSEILSSFIGTCLAGMRTLKDGDEVINVIMKWD